MGVALRLDEVVHSPARREIMIAAKESGRNFLGERI
jgi:hypothetical protein